MSNRDTIAATVGGNIRALRQDRALTLTELAEQARISVRTLVEIEGGRANASLATLGGLADALGVDFGRLIQGGESRPSRIVHIADAAVLWSDGLGSEARHLLISREPQSVELLQWLLKPGGSYEAQPDPDGTDILLSVSSGALTLTAEDHVSQLTAGTAGHIVSSTGYTLANTGQADAVFTLVHIPPAAARARYTRTVAKSQGNALSGAGFGILAGRVLGSGKAYVALTNRGIPIETVNGRVAQGAVPARAPAVPGRAEVPWPETGPPGWRRRPRRR